MKRFIFVLLLIFTISFVACGTNVTETSSTIESTFDIHVETVDPDVLSYLEALLEHDLSEWVCDITVFDLDGAVDVSVRMNCTLQDFSFCCLVYSTMEAVNAVYQEYGITFNRVSITEQEPTELGDDLLSWWTGDLSEGTLFDSRSTLVASKTYEQVIDYYGFTDYFFGSEEE